MTGGHRGGLREKGSPALRWVWGPVHGSWFMIAAILLEFRSPLECLMLMSMSQIQSLVLTLLIQSGISLLNLKYFLAGDHEWTGGRIIVHSASPLHRMTLV